MIVSDRPIAANLATSVPRELVFAVRVPARLEISMTFHNTITSRRIDSESAILPMTSLRSKLFAPR
jgi:hypothetical protein